MLSLDSNDWSALFHAYGEAADIPPLLRELRRDPSPQSANEDPWFTLWSCLCHQGDVFSASYAAVPHLVEIASHAPGQIDLGFFLLPACVEIARRKGRGPALSDAASQDYFLALRRLHVCAHTHADDEWNLDMAKSVAAALAAAKGQVDLAEALLNLDQDKIERILAGEL